MFLDGFPLKNKVIFHVDPEFIQDGATQWCFLVYKPH